MNPTSELVRAWKPAVPGIREAFHARFIEHSYPRHTHETWTVFIVDSGEVRYHLAGREHGALPSMVTVHPPGVVHDGRPAGPRGFHKRVLYLEPDLLDEHAIGAAVDRPIIWDRALHQSLATIHGLLQAPDDAFEAESRLALIIERIRRQLRQPNDDRPSMPSDDMADALRSFLDDHVPRPVTLANAAASIGASPAHLARSFTRAFGIPPYSYLLGKRVDRARQLLLEGWPPAQVAVNVGFYDQAHLTRHFRRHTGATPRRFSSDRGRNL